MGDRDTHYHKDILPPCLSFKKLLTKLLSLVNYFSLDSNNLGYTTKLKHKRLIPDTACLTTLIKCTIKRLTSNCSLSLCKRNKNNKTTLSCKLLHTASVKKCQCLCICLMGQINLHVLMAYSRTTASPLTREEGCG